METKITNKVINTKGFSLIELMIVVAIIGLLAAIGIPQYAKFQAKARQSESKGHLTSIYTAELSFKGEWNGFSSNLLAIGVAASGSSLRYTAGFAGSACGLGGRSVGAPAEATGNTQLHLSTVSPVNIWYTNAITYNTAVTFAGFVCTDLVFTAYAAGDPKNTPGTANSIPDQWTIDQEKLISQIAVGL